MKRNIKKGIALVLVAATIFTTTPNLQTSYAQNKKEMYFLSLEDMNFNDEKIFYDAIEHELNKQNFNNEHERQIFKNQLISLFKENKTYSIIPEHMGIGKKVMAAGLNVSISVLVGGVGAGAVQSYIKKVGKDAAKRMFYKTIRSRLMAWGATKFAISLGVAVDFILTYSDFGARIADFWDENDAVPNNGWCDFY